MTRYDIAIVGAGIAGASLAARLAPHGRVVILEAEELPGYHATGRSAAFWSETYGGPAIQPLSTASGPWLWNPPPDYGDASFLSPRGELFVATAADASALEAMAVEFADSGVALERIDPRPRVPGLRVQWSEALWEPSCADIDVAALHAACLKVARRGGAELRTDAALKAAERRDGVWHLTTVAGTIAADILVNAAGAWADPVAKLAGVRPLGIAAYRRTMVQLAVEPALDPDLPLIRDARDRFYVKPEAGGRAWLSPHDEIPSPACDAQPEELDVAIAVDRLQQAVDWNVRVERTWAGLRSFAPDRLPVYGFDLVVPGFFWFAGQGGFGIQTAPAAAALAAAQLGAPASRIAARLDPATYSPKRLN
ncbi:MAG: FAD-dependent oxidoreductase [Pseudomonadota bacterium]